MNEKMRGRAKHTRDTAKRLIPDTRSHGVARASLYKRQLNILIYEAEVLDVMIVEEVPDRTVKCQIRIVTAYCANVEELAKA